MKRLIKYEIRNSLGNFFAIFFGLFFPILMTYILLATVIKDVPSNFQDQAIVRLFITNLLMIPLAMMFVGFSALFSQELEKDVLTRLSLFGLSESKQMIAKMVAQFLLMFISIFIFIVATAPFIKLVKPSAFAVLTLVIFIILLSIALFILSFSIALLAKRFSITYGITMSLYFAMMIFSGMMGIDIQELSSPLQKIAHLFPTSYLISDYQTAWFSSSYNFAPLIRSLISFLCFSGIICLIALRKHSRARQLAS